MEKWRFILLHEVTGTINLHNPPPADKSTCVCEIQGSSLLSAGNGSQKPANGGVGKGEILQIEHFL